MTQENYEVVNYCEFDKFASRSYSAVHDIPESLNLGDITKVDETKLTPFKMICGGSPCFVAGTQVLTAKGYKAIEDVKIGDMVYTHKHNWQRVERIGCTPMRPTYKVQAQGILPLIVTGNHPVYVRHRGKNKQLGEIQKKRVEELSVSDYVGIPIIRTSENVLNLTAEECWILGRYVADGYIYNKSIVLTIAHTKMHQLADNIETIDYVIYPTPNACCMCTIKNKRLYKIASKYIKYYAINKNIPPEIMNLPVRLLKRFLDGYFDGDGYVVDAQTRRASTISKELALDLVLAIQKVYEVGCSIGITHNEGECYIKGVKTIRHTAYYVQYTVRAKHTRYIVMDDTIWYPIRKIVALDRFADVYNLQVAKDHSYMANGCYVSNCQDFSLAGKQAGSRWICKDCGHEYNPLMVHYSDRDKCPACGSVNLDKTRSSLLVEWLRVVRANNPVWGIYENVKNITGRQFSETFAKFVAELRDYGYNVYHTVLNSKNYGIPQNRERLYLIIIKKEYDNGKFRFPAAIGTSKKLKDMLEDEVDEKYYIDNPRSRALIQDLIDKGKLPQVENREEK